MAAPIALGTLALGAYLNAKLKLSSDLRFLSAYSAGLRHFERVSKNKRISGFSILEEHVSNPKIADEIFIICDDKSWTFRQTLDIVLRYAGWLHSTHNVVAGEIVSLDFMNSPQMTFLILTIWSLGASPALINYNLTSKPLIHSVRVSTARLLIVDPQVAGTALTDETKDAFRSTTFRNNAFPLDISVLDTGLQSSLNYFPPYRASDNVHEQVKPSDIAVLLYTSGTTGMPKAAIVTWSRVVIGGQICAKVLGLNPVDRKQPDRFYTCMPLYHTMGFTLGFNACLQSATTLVIGRKFSVSNFWVDVHKSKATVIQYVGETLRYLVAAPPTPYDRDHKVRMAFGNGLRPDVWRKFKIRFGIDTIAEVYGMTEGVSATWNLSRNDYSEGAISSQGKLLQFLGRKQRAIVKVDWETEQPWRNPATGLCELVPGGNVGELLFAMDPSTAEEQFRGYLNNKEATSKKLVRNVLKQGDVYFRTGDVVRFDSEGRLFFSDRIGDTFRWKSENVSTAEVSDVIGHHPAVNEANVYGVSLPQHEGRAGCVAILLKDNALQNINGDVSINSDTLESLAVYSTNSLPKYAVPLFLRVAKELALTGTNKQQKVGLRSQGVDIEAISNAGSSDKIYWLKPGARRYVEFTRSDFKALEQGKVRL